LPDVSLPFTGCLEPLEQPQALRQAPARERDDPSDRHRGDFEAPGHNNASGGTASGAGATGNREKSRSISSDTDIREIVRTILGSTLKLNYTIDPNVHVLARSRPLAAAALGAAPALETLLNEKWCNLVEKNGIYALFRSPWARPARAARGCDSAGTQWSHCVMPRRKTSPRRSTLCREGGKHQRRPGAQRAPRARRRRGRGTLTSLMPALDIDLLLANHTPLSGGRQRSC